MSIKNNISDFLNKHLKEDINTPATLFIKDKDEAKFGNAYIFKKFGLAQADSLKLSSQITTHYMEDNVAYQDHWAIAPLSYTMSGLVGEIVYSTPSQWSSFIQDRFVDYLTPLQILSPTFDSYTQSAINTINAVEASYRRYEQIAKQFFQNLGILPTRQSSQEYLVSALTQLRDNRQLVSVYTPYGVYDNLAIQDISITQNNSKYQSQLEIQFVQWRNITTLTRKATKEEMSNVAQAQKAEVEQQGQASTTKKSTFATRLDNNEPLIQGIK